MNSIISKTFGGLKKSYYFRQLFFGTFFLAMMVFARIHTKHTTPRDTAELVNNIIMYAFPFINTILYPYARFVYESIVEFIVGDNIFFVNGIIMLFVKAFTMTICWTAAIFIAPVGLAYLYYLNRDCS